MSDPPLSSWNSSEVDFAFSSGVIHAFYPGLIWPLIRARLTFAFGVLDFAFDSTEADLAFLSGLDFGFHPFGVDFDFSGATLLFLLSVVTVLPLATSPKLLDLLSPTRSSPKQEDERDKIGTGNDLFYFFFFFHDSCETKLLLTSWSKT